MRQLNFKQFINILLVLLLFVAPFESLFAQFQMSHSMQNANSAQSVQFDQFAMKVSHEITDHSSHSSITDTDLVSSDQFDENSHFAKDLNQDCEKKCAHCVFCSAAVISNIHLNESLISIYNPHITIYLSGITSDVAIRPPRIYLPV